MIDDGKYGYAQGISQDDMNSGIMTKPLIMVEFLGKTNDEISVKLLDSQYFSLATCKIPCDFVKIADYLYNGVVVQEETIPNVAGSLIWAITQDAMNGYLKQSNYMIQSQTQTLPQTQDDSTNSSPSQSDSPSQSKNKTEKTESLKNSTTSNPSFNCAMAITDVEKMICGNSELSSLDNQMAAIYKARISNSEMTDQIASVKRDQRFWRDEIRNKCTTIECISTAYKQRIYELTAQKNGFSTNN